ncbi:hypothetical protein A2U01_0038424, partial [Trifolium medium]|nr:hypothetical protein [Trifolium medium]
RLSENSSIGSHCGGTSRKVINCDNLGGEPEKVSCDSTGDCGRAS